jgi:RNA polymerase sigma factor (sigma-70 family)
MSQDWPDFKHVDWTDLYPRLLLFTEGSLRRMRRHSFRPLVASDFVHAVIEKAISGERSWDPRKTLFQNFLQVISSLISNDITSYENQMGQPTSDRIADLSDNVIDLRSHPKSPESASIDKFETERILSYLEERDPEARKVAELILCEDLQPSLEIALRLKIPVSDVENVRKRLKRLCIAYQREHGSWRTLAQASATEGVRK